MKIFVAARPGAREDKVEEVSEGHLKIWVKDPPKEGKANQGIIKILSGYFSIAPSRVRLIVGATSRQKVFEIN